MPDLEPLPQAILAITEQRTLEPVLTTIIHSVARQSGVALARLWLLETDGACPLCSNRGVSPGTALHLRASAGDARLKGADWSRIDGAFHRVALSNHDLKISRIASTGESIRITDLVEDRRWIRFPEWARSEGLVSFAGHALIFRGCVLGVLAVFRREEAHDQCFAWLHAMASAAAVAIANARAFEENDSLRQHIENERQYLREEVQTAGSFGQILGTSPALNRVLQRVEMVAATDASVLVLGESGTGKELIARAIHNRSSRAHKPLVKVNCGSIPQELFESEFFGHVRGSFTGAVRDRVGRFQLADGGTLFLDEIGEIPVALQTKLLRVLQEGEFERVGDELTRRVNVRVIAATNRDLLKDVDNARFRLDLYYRLSVFPLHVSPLRERLEDIPTLINHFIREAALRFHLPAPSISKGEVERAQRYHWPGNVRELQNVVERAVIISRGGSLIFDLPEAGKTIQPTASADSPMSSKSESVITEQEWRERERVNLLNALRQSDGRISGKRGAAELLGVKPGTLSSRLRALGIHNAHLRAMACKDALRTRAAF